MRMNNTSSNLFVVKRIWNKIFMSTHLTNMLFLSIKIENLELSFKPCATKLNVPIHVHTTALSQH